MRTLSALASLTRSSLAVCSLAVSWLAVGAAAGVAAAQNPPSTPPPLRLMLVDRSGSMTSLGTLPGTTFAPRLSPDGRRIAYDTFDGGIWIADLSNVAAARRVITGRFPMWSADGTRMFFAGSDGMRLFSQAADGSGMPELIADNARAPESLSSADASITFITLTGQGDYDIWAYSLRDRAVRPLVAGPGAAQMGSRFSPDGRWLAYESNDQGAFEIYIRPANGSAPAARVTKAGGRRAVWSADGGEILYERERRLYAVRVRTGPPIEIGAEVELPIGGFVQGTGRRQYELMPDGKLLMLFP
jgi:Tol biopolymer transport system component